MLLPELLSPAGDMEKLKAAVRFGADAVYCAGRSFGMRSASANFTPDELSDAVRYCHERNVRLYVAVNILPRDSEYPALKEFLGFLGEIGADAAIVADLGVIEAARKAAPSLPLHLSTQASVVSSEACAAYHRFGVKRIVLARELSLEAIREIRKNIPDTLELEAFVHGAMCVAYSGRCLLSNYLVGRDANRGECAQSCRWDYRPEGDGKTLCFFEEKRPDEIFSVREENGESFILSSRDLCMIEHIPDLVTSGLSSLKIEGRVKSAYYAALTANTYRISLDAYGKDPDHYVFDEKWLRELCSVSHREYSTGFFYSSPSQAANTVSRGGYLREKAYFAAALEDSGADGWTLFFQKNKVSSGDQAELLTPGKTGVPLTVGEMTDEHGAPIPSAPHPGMRFRLKMPFPVREGDILRSGDPL